MATKKMRCIDVSAVPNTGVPKNLTLNKIYDVDPEVVQDSAGSCYRVVRDDGRRALTLCKRFAEVTQEAPVASAPTALPPTYKPSPPPTFVCRCVICDKQLESVIGLMAIAYPYSSVALSFAPGVNKELQVACEGCSRDLALLIKHKKKVSGASPLPDPEDFW